MKKSRSLFTAFLIAAAALTGSWFLFGGDDRSSVANRENESPEVAANSVAATLAPVPSAGDGLPAKPTARLETDAARKRTSAHSRFRVRGKLIDDRESPIRAAFVIIYADSTPPAISKSTNFAPGDGSFEIELPRAGEWSFEGRAEGHHDSAGALTIKLPQAEENELELRLVRHSLIEGHVLDPEGAPVSNANVWQGPKGRGPGDWTDSTWTDGQGYFALRVRSAGVIEIQAVHQAWSASHLTQVELARDEIVSDVVLVLQAGGTITGEAFERGGSPAAHSEVELEPVDQRSGSRKVVTDSAGRFQFERVTPGNYGIVMEYAEEEEPSAEVEKWDMLQWLNGAARVAVEVKQGESVHALLGKALNTAVVVHGTVTRGGKPVRDMLLIVAPGKLMISTLNAVAVLEDGTYEITLSAAGEHQFVFMNNEDRTRGEFAQVIPQVRRIELNFALPSGAIQGRVLDQDGTPAADFRVWIARDDGYFSLETLAEGVSTKTDKLGRFDFQGLRSGKYALRASGQFSSTIEQQVGATIHTGLVVRDGEVLDDIELQLRPACSLTGTARNAAGDLLDSFSIFVRDSRGRLLSNRGFAESDSGGKFSLSHLPPGEHAITARSTNLATRAPVRVQVSAHESETITLVLEPGTILKLTAKDAKNFRLSVRDASGNEYASMIGERFNLGHGALDFSPARRDLGPLPPGRYTIVATADDGREVKRTVQLNGEPEHQLELPFK